MVELVCLGVLAVFAFFASLSVFETYGSIVGSLFILMIALGYGLNCMTYYKRKKAGTVKLTMGKGYEEQLYYLGMVAHGCSLLMIYMGHVVTSMVSPIVIMLWLLPLIAYLKNESLIHFYQKEFVYQGQTVPYRSIKTIHAQNNKKKRKLTLSGQGKTYVFTGSIEYIDQVEQAMLKYCHKVK